MEENSKNLTDSVDSGQGNDVGDAWGLGKPSRVHRIARMPVERFGSEYNMNHRNRGFALIFNHEYFDLPSLNSRSGTAADCENLVKSFQRLDFTVCVFNDLKYREILREIEAVSRLDHSDNDCIAICILSHGELGYIYARDGQYKLESIWTYFTADRCPTLAGKPKLFFIQACQGDQLDGGITLLNDRTETDSSSTGGLSYKIPNHADFLIAYSTIPGFYSWRNTTKGSWFMQSLCQELNEHGTKYDLLTILTFVCRRVAIDFESNAPDRPKMHQQKQIPCITTMMTRILRFNEK
ncbi:caspase-like [Culicoides brevitarsis]|uniref:caspase-like n=1 Tax=Culicoides brevitarsis TaxID=469753 RepID=UPI00307C8A30